jgi:thymidylate synthase (FAD)
MGVDAHTLKDMIIKFTKTKYSKITELNEFGNLLYEIAKENIPYIITQIDNYNSKDCDEVFEYLEEKINKENENYKILDKTKLLNHSKNIDDIILITSIMKRYQFDYEKAKKIYNKLLEENPNLKDELMKKIAFESDKSELSQVNFQFQIPISFAVLTHLTRHRTHNILVPDFVPIIDLNQYKIPPKIKNTCEDEFNQVFKLNKKIYEEFKANGVRDEDLIYFTLSGNMVNVITNMDGKTIEHILGLRECNKTQWETRQMANEIHNEIRKLDNAKTFSSILGPTCETQGFCKEGKESCGKILKLEK